MLAQGENCDGFVGLVMQRGEDENLAEFLKNPKRRNMDIILKLPFAKRLVDILIAVSVVALPKLLFVRFCAAGCIIATQFLKHCG